MIFGHGVDIINVERIERAVDRWGNHFLNRIFTPQEIQYCLRKAHAAQAFAVRFAAKEAFSKAIRTGVSGDFKWRDVEIVLGEKNSPEISLHDTMREKYGHLHINLSLSHTRHDAIASVILESSDT